MNLSLAIHESVDIAINEYKMVKCAQSIQIRNQFNTETISYDYFSL